MRYQKAFNHIKEAYLKDNYSYPCENYSIYEWIKSKSQLMGYTDKGSIFYDLEYIINRIEEEKYSGWRQITMFEMLYFHQTLELIQRELDDRHKTHRGIFF